MFAAGARSIFATAMESRLDIKGKAHGQKGTGRAHLLQLKPPIKAVSGVAFPLGCATFKRFVVARNS
jgi:hypothetical protein